MFQSWQNRTRRLWEKNWCNSALPYSPAIGCLFASTEHCHHVNSSAQEKLRKPKQRWTVDPAWVHEVVAFVHQLSHEERRPLWRQVGLRSKPVMAFLPFFLLELTSLTFQWPRLWRPRVPHVNSLEHGRGQQPCLLLSQVDLRFCEKFTSIFLFQAYSPPHSKSRRNWHPWADQVTSRGCYCIYTITILQMHHGESQRRGRLLARKWDPCAPFCRACCWSPVDTGTVTVLFDYNVWPTNFYSDWLS